MDTEFTEFLTSQGLPLPFLNVVDESSPQPVDETELRLFLNRELAEPRAEWVAFLISRYGDWHRAYLRLHNELAERRAELTGDMLDVSHPTSTEQPGGVEDQILMSPVGGTDPIPATQPSSSIRKPLASWGDVANLTPDVIAQTVAGEATSQIGNRELIERARSRLIGSPVTDIQADAWLMEMLSRGVERLLKEEALRQFRDSEDSGRSAGNTVSSANDITITTARSRPALVVARLRALGELDEIDARQALLYRLHVFAGRSVTTDSSSPSSSPISLTDLPAKTCSR